MIQRFDYNGVLHDTDYAEGTYVRYADYISALESITKDIVDKAWAKGYAEAKDHYTNSCLLCGYSEQWSMWICDTCIEERGRDDERS